MQRTLSDLRILVIEDQAESRALLRGMLMELGISQIYEVEDGKKGLRFIDHASDMVDIILCDWNMPSMSGLELLQDIRERGAKTPFMIISGRSDEKSMMEAKAAGVSGFIRKPYTPGQMEARLRVLVDRIKTG